jgi:hypothetical protein
MGEEFLESLVMGIVDIFVFHDVKIILVLKKMEWFEKGIL